MFGGLLYIMEKIKVRNVIICKQGENSENYKKFKEIVKKKGINIILVKQGDKINVEKDVYFDILFPEDELLQENVLNNNSIVAKLHYRDFSALFTGDIEQIAEKKIVEKYEKTEKLRSTLLKVAHHGSKSSSIKEILDKIRPKISLIGVGKNNTFGHPNEEVLNRLKAYGTKIYRTDEVGEIIVTVDMSGKIRINFFKKKY